MGESPNESTGSRVQKEISRAAGASPIKVHLDSTALGAGSVARELQFTATDAEATPAPSAAPDFPPGLVPPPGAPSHGSVLHSTRNCRPCAWFWKPTGCQNGQQCGHCHLCPEGELRARKKAKQTVMRYGLATPKATPVEMESAMINPFMFGNAPWESLISEHESTNCSGSEQDLIISSGSDQDMSSPERDAGTLAASVAMNVRPSASYSAMLGPVPWLGDFQHGATAANTQSPPGLPPVQTMQGNDIGSHAYGTCRPCAWYWKPGGCQNASSCSFCHICPEGELKVRKKSKQAMLRLGLITPKSSSSTETDAKYALSLAACI